MQNQRALAAIRAAARMVVLSKRLGRDGAAEEAENGNAIETVGARHPLYNPAPCLATTQQPNDL